MDQSFMCMWLYAVGLISLVLSDYAHNKDAFHPATLLWFVLWPISMPYIIVRELVKHVAKQLS